MKRYVNKITLIVLILCISLFTQGCIKTEYEEEEPKEKSNIAQILSGKIYKLPCVIEYTGWSDVAEEDVHQVHNWDFVFTDTIVGDDVWCLETNSSNLITKATLRKDTGSYDISRFEYDTNNRVVRITEGYSSIEDGNSIEVVDIEYLISYENEGKTLIVDVNAGYDGKLFDKGIHKITVNDNYNVIQSELIDGESICFWHPPVECKYDKYGNIVSIECSNTDARYYELCNINYEGDNIVRADVLDENYKYSYDVDGYLSELQCGDDVFRYEYKEFTEDEYYALKKLSVLWFPATYTYYMQPSTHIVNYYKY